MRSSSVKITPRVWDKAKWHAERVSPSTALRHILFVLRWLKRKKLTTLVGDEEATGIMGDDSSVSSEMVTERGNKFLENYYANWLENLDYTADFYRGTRLNKLWREFVRRYPNIPSSDSIKASGLSPKQNAIYRRFRQQELSDGVEVEHILSVTLKSDASLIPVLNKLRDEFAWPEGKKALRSHAAPMGTWVKICCHYLSGGASSVVSLIKQSRDKVERDIGQSFIDHCQTQSRLARPM